MYYPYDSALLPLECYRCIPDTTFHVGKVVAALAPVYSLTPWIGALYHRAGRAGGVDSCGCGGRTAGLAAACEMCGPEVPAEVSLEHLLAATGNWTVHALAFAPIICSPQRAVKREEVLAYPEFGALGQLKTAIEGASY